MGARKGRHEWEGVSDSQLKIFIGDALEDMPSDVLRLLYRIVKASESGLE